MLELTQNNNKEAPLNTSDFDADSKEKLYFYTINYTEYEEELCKTEMKYLFGTIPNNKYFFSSSYVAPSRSPFIKLCVSVLYTGDSLEEIVKEIILDNLSLEKFKVYYINLEDEVVDFNERHSLEGIIGWYINGQASMRNPSVFLGMTKVYGKWILGTCDRNKGIWMLHNKKPFFYSNALSVKAARALVNIATGSGLSYKLIDPCCGIGTVLIEALSMGIDIKGCEINPLIAENAKKNLEYFGFKDIITIGDMNKIEDIFDAAIVDLPYGLYSKTSLRQQMDIIKSTRRISKKAVIVTMTDMEEHFIKCGFKIIDKICLYKSSFKRYITICE